MYEKIFDNDVKIQDVDVAHDEDTRCKGHPRFSL